MRLTSRTITPAAAPIRFTFDGREVEALPGETIAAALSAAGILALRRTPAGAPRGLWCGMGACFDCIVTVDGKSGQRACLVKAEPGLRVEGAPPANPAPLADPPTAHAERACDVVTRRLSLALLDNAAAIAVLPRVVELMAGEQDWSAERRDAEMAMGMERLTVAI